MKYEMIFGDEKLFAGVPEYVEFIRYNSYSRDYLWGDLNVIHHLGFKDLTALPIVAMRRIIQEPKNWTVEDQKAGRLPEVGCAVYSVRDRQQATVVAIDDDGDIWFQGVNRCVRCTDCYYSIHPLETPEEKAERLRSEWINDAINAVQKTDNTGGYEAIYDALLSGALSAPTKGGE